MVKATGKNVVWFKIVDENGDEIASTPRDETNLHEKNTGHSISASFVKGGIGQVGIGGKEYKYKITDVTSGFSESGHFLTDVVGKLHAEQHESGN